MLRGELARIDRDRSVLLPGRRTRREGGMFTNTQRLLQWHDKAVDPPGDCPERRLVRLPARPPAEGEAPPPNARQERRAARADVGLPDGRTARRARQREVLREINGFSTRDGQQVAGFRRSRGGRQHSVRLLDLFRRLSGGRTEPRARQERQRSVRTRVGDTRGPRIAESSTTARPRGLTAAPGASARNSSGGTRQSARMDRARYA